VPAPVEFFFDFVSSYSFLASTRVEAIVTKAGGTVRWRPFFLPGVFKATGNGGPTAVPAKAQYAWKDTLDWVAHLGLPPLKLSDSFPFATVTANRIALVIDEQGKLREFAERTFNEIWVQGSDPNDPAVLSRLIVAVGADPEAVLPRAQAQEIKDRLRANTDEAVKRGAFGAPTFFIGDEMFVGNDRLDFVERALLRAR
jgi:2-hydroxychromene-2-carboxylate isomerase